MIAARPLFLIPALLLAGGICSGAESKLDPRIFAGRESASFLVVMREQADLSGAEAFTGKAAKGRFVYEALRAQAEASQAPLRASLDAAGVSYRNFYLVNMIEVEGDRSLAQELAARDDVATVAPNLEARLDPEPVVEQQTGASPDALRLMPHASHVFVPSITHFF